MAAEVAVVTKVTGQAWIRTDDGQLVAVHEGQRIPLDTVIITGDGASVQLSADGVPSIMVGANREFVFSGDVVQTNVDSADSAVSDTPALNTLATLLNSGQDPFAVLEATAATKPDDRAFSIHVSNLGSAGNFDHVSGLVRLLGIQLSSLPLNEQTTGFTTPLVGTLDNFFTHGSGSHGDASGNDSGSGSGSGSISSLAVSGNSPALVPARASIAFDTIAGDNIINSIEARGDVLVSGSVGGDVRAGDLVRVTVGDVVYVTSVQEGSVWSVNVPGSLLSGHGSISAQVATTGADTQSTSATVEQSYATDLSATATITIDSVANDYIVNAAESAGTIAITGKVGGDAKAGDVVTVTVGGHTFIATVGADNTWSVNVAGSALVGSTSVSAAISASDAAGNTATASATHAYSVDLAPTAQAGSVQGVEDTPLVLTWNDFKVTDDSRASEQGLHITGLPGNGVLEYSSDPGAANAVWTTVTLTNGHYDISRADIEAGKLRFVPGENESSSGSGAAGVGNGHADYAQITYQPVDGQNVGQSSVLTVDMTPVADAPTVSLSLGDISEGGSGGATFTFDGITLQVGADGSVSASGSGLTGSLQTSPFDASTGGNINDNDPHTDVIAVIGNFDQVVHGRDGHEWENLHGISGNGDYVFFSKAESAYQITNEVINVNNGVAQISATVTDLATGISMNLNNIRGILFGDGGSVGGDASKHISGLDTQTVEGGYHDVDVHVVAALTDRDGSESLSGVTLSGVPAGVTIDGAIQLSNGDWFVANDSNQMTVDTHLTMRVPNGTEPFSLTASATSSEYGASANSSTTTVTLDAVDVEASATITIDNVTGDNVVNAAEAAGTVAVTGSVGGDAKAGDTVTVHIGDHSFTTTVAEGKTWTVGVDGSVLAGNTSISASVTASDAGGNTTTVSATHAYGVDTSANAAITIDSVTADNIVNAAESAGSVVITGAVGGDASVGDTVTVQIGDQVLTTRVVEGNTWSVSVDGSVLAGNTSISASVSASDAVGNTTRASTSQSYGVDTSASATISIDAVTSDNVVNAAESGGTVTITGSVGGDAKEGDTVTVHVGEREFTATVAENGTWSVDVAGSVLTGNTSISASVSASDVASNTTTANASHTYTVDTTAEATISIDAVTSDNVVNAAESGGTVTITGSVGGDAKEGDTVTVHVGDQEFSATVAENGTWSVGVDGELLAGHTSVSASVAASDAAGNTTTANANHTYSVDTVANATITINDVTADNVVNAAESGDTVTITGSVGGDAKEGDTVTVHVGEHEFSATVTENGTWSVGVAGSVLAGNTSVSASITATDAAGNTATADASHSYTVDTTASATVTINDVTADNVINHAESNATVTITGSVGGDAKEGDTVTVHVGEHEFSATVTENGTWSVDVAGSVLAGNTSISASVSASDAAGNTTTANASHTYTVDTTAEATIAIDSITADNVVNAAESGGTVTITGSVGGDAKEGDTVTVHVGEHEFSATVAEGGTWSVGVAGSVLAGNTSVSASITAIDAAGNTATANAAQSYTVDTVANATISIDAVTSDNVVNAAESGGTVTITGFVGGDAKEGDTVTVHVGEHEFAATVAEGGTWSVGVDGALLAGNTSISASVSASDAAGNTTTANANHTYSVDTVASATITINDVTNDNVVNAAESGGMATITGSVGGDAKEGDTVTVHVGEHEFSATVEEGGTWSVDVAGSVLAGNTSVSASITATDAAGNTATANAAQSYTVDTVANATVSIDAVTSDNVVNAAESGDTVTITGSVGGDAKEGDTVTVHVGEHEFAATVAENGTWSVGVAGSILAGNTSISASVSASDAAGNTTTANASHTYTVDTTAEATIAIDSVTADNVVNATESGSTVTVTGSVGGDAKEGDAVTVHVGEHEFSATVAENGTWSVDVAGSVLAGNASVSASITATDAAGNTATANAAQSYTVDTTAEATISIDSVTSDNVVNAAESGDTVTITGSVGGDAKEGDTVTVHVGEHEFTATVAEGGTWSVDVAGSVLAGNTSVSASVAASDTAGNTTTANANHTYSVDTVASATITINDVTSDNVVNATESGGTVTITGSVGGDAKEGDTVTVHVGEHGFTATVTEGGTWSVDVAGSVLAGNTSVSASITAMDAAGNTATANAAQSYTVDTTAEATIAIDLVTSDNVVNAAESGGTVTITGSVGGDAKEGDTVTVHVGEHEFSTTVTENGTWSVGVEGELLAGNTSVSASITATDAAGNTATANAAQSYTVDTVANATVTINDVTADNVINHAESNATVTITGSVGGDAKEGDTVTVHVGEHEFTATVTENGTWSVGVDGALLAGNTSVSASVAASDAAGNTTTANASHTYSVDTVANATVSIDAITSDNVVNAAESGDTVTITGSVGGDAKAGDTVTVHVGEHEFTATVAENGAWSVDVAGSVLAGNTSVSASVSATDAAGNTATANASHTYTVDTTANATITINDVTSDNVVNATESGGTVTITGSVGGDAKEGDTVTVHVGEHEFTATVEEGGTWSVGVAGSILAGNTSVSASVAASDTAGNTTTANASHTYSVDTAAEATISIDAVTNDNVVNAAESGNTVTITGSVGGDAKAGDTVTVHVGESEFSATVTEGGTWSVDVAGSVLAGHTSVSASITATDAAGNMATADASHSYTVDTTAEATIAIDSITADNVVNATESGDTVTITGSVGGDAKEGDTVTVHVGESEFSATVAENGSWSVDVAGSVLVGNTSVSASIMATDAAGNTATANAAQSYTVDTTANATITINDVTADNVVNAAESGDTVTITGSVGGDAKAGDMVTVHVGDQEFTAQVTADKSWSVGVDGALLAGNTSVSASITATDAAGNTATANAAQSYTVDTVANATVSIDAVTSDNVINHAESNTTVTITGTVGGDAKEGDTVTIHVGEHEFSATVAENGTWSVDVAGSVLAGNTSISASVSASDAAGNTATANASHTYSVDTTAEATIMINDVTADNVVNAAESGDTVTITGSVGGDAKEGDAVTVHVGEHEFSATVAEGGTWSVDVAGSVLAGNASVSASITATDAAGNTATADASHAYTVDTVANATISIDAVTNDNVINHAESNATVTITGSAGGDAKEGDTVTVHVGEHEFSATVTENGTWSVDVAGSVLAGNTSISASVVASDVAGNTATANASHTYSVDTTAEATIAIDSITADNVVNAAESGDTVTITGSVGGDAKEGDTVTVHVGEHEFSATVAEGGTWSVDVAGSVLVGNTSVSASVSASDAAGNTTTANASHTYSVDTVANATISIDAVTSDNVVNATESGDTITITGSVGGDTKEGDTVTVHVGEHEFTATVTENGTWSVGVAGSVLAGNTSVSASITATDAAGNTTTANANHTYSVDTVANATITINDVTADNVVNAAESGDTVTITGSVGGDAKEGDTVTVHVGDQEFTAEVTADKSWSVGVDGALLAGNASVSASVSASDAAGNTTTANANHTYSVDTAAEATISIDAVTSDNVVNATESGETVTITGSVGGDAKEGDTVTVHVGEHEFSATVAENGTWSVDVAGSVLAGNTSMSASITATDAAGNTATANASHSYTVDTTAEATIAIDSITADNVVNATESGSTVTITGSVGGDAKVGDTVTVTVGEQSFSATVVEGNTWSVGVDGALLAGNTSISASVAASDAAGNTTTANASHTYSVDTVANATINIDAVTSDSVVNATESGNTVTITGSVGGDAKEGDTVTVHVGEHEFSATVVEGGTWSVDVAGSVLAGNTSVSASVSASDAAGNTTTANASHTYTVDTTAEATIAIDSVTSDNVVNATESGNTVTITGSVGGDAKEGNTVTVHVGEHEFTATVEEGGTWSVGVAGSVLAGNTSISASVSASDAAGNTTTANASHTYSVDTVASATITINDVTSDNVVNAAESGDTVTITGSVGGDAKEGDTVTVHVGEHEFSATVTENGAWSVDVAGSVLAGNTSVSASVTATDAAGNTATADASHSYTVDTTASATVTINDVTVDNVVNAAESGGTVSITGSVGGDAKEGDTVTVHVGEHEFTATVEEGGTWSVGVAGSILAGNTSISASVVASDVAGNTTTANASHSYSVDTVANATIAIDSITADNVVNAAESGNTVTITGSVGGDAKEGDTVTVHVGEHEFAATVTENGTWSVDVAGSILAGNTSISASVSASDAAGNTATANASHSYTVDTAAEATIAIDSITADNVVNAAESGGTVTITGSVGGDAKEGDTVTVHVGEHEFTATVTENGSWSVGVAGSVLAGNTSISASVSASDAAGNTTTANASHTYSVDTAAEATISIDAVTNDNVVNAAESGDTITITGSVGGDAKEGDTVTVHVGEHEFSATVAEGGTWSVDVAGSVLAGNTSVSASITATDAAGNTATANAAQPYTVDTVANATITINDVTADNVVNAAESDGMVAITGTVGGDAKVGDTVTVTVGEQSFSATVTEGGTWSVDVAGSVLAGHTSVSASITATDTAGNTVTANAAQSYTVDTTANATITINDVTADNVVNAAESGGTVTITGSVGGDAKAGDTVTVHVGEHEFTATVTEGGTWSVGVAGSVLAGNTSVSASVSASDAAGNTTTANASHAYSVDTVASATITINDVTSDNVVNATESGDTVTITGSVGGDAKEGDTVTVHVGEHEFAATVAESGTWSVDVAGSVLAGNTSVSASITATDAAGNTATANASHTYTVDTTASATITINDVTADNVVNAAESGGTVTITGSVGGDAKEGDTVTIHVGVHEFAATVTEGGTWSVDVAGSVLAGNTSVSASITATDTAGNTATADASHTYTVDTTASATVTINDVAVDNVVNAAESGGTVTITGTVGGDAKAGDTVTVHVGEHEFAATVVENGTWSVDVAGLVLAGNTSISASVSASDAAGNTTTANASHTYSVDTVANATIAIDSVTSDNVVNAAESGDTVTITGSVGGDAKEGDTVTVHVGEHEFAATVAEGGTWSVDVAGSVLVGNTSISASVSVSDVAGNTATANASHTYSVDTAAEATISIDAVTSDNVVNAAESGNTVTIAGSVGGDAKAGDTVTVHVGESEFSATVAENGSWSVDVAGSILAGNTSISASVSASDAAGNTTTANANHTYSVDTVANATITINDVTSDNVVNATESGNTVTITGSVGGDAKEGDTVTVHVGDQEFTVHVTADKSWSVDVAGSILAGNTSVSASITATDAAGNTATANAAQSYTVDTVANATVSIDAVTSDNVVNAAESGGTVTITGSVGGDAKAGDTVTVHVGEHEFAATVVENGTWSVDVAGLVLAGNTSISASVSASDAAGNTTTANANHTYSVDTAAEATISIDAVTSDNVVNATESGETVTISGSVGGDAKAGDVVTVTVGGHTFTATVGADNTWSVNVAGSALVGSTSISAAISATDAAGNTATASATHGYSVDLAPTVQAGSVQGVEDTPLVLTWNDFKVTDDSPSSEQGLHITGLPGNGVLEYSSDPGAANAVWTVVTLTDGYYDISRADIEAGKLRFVPGENESSWSDSSAAGVGNGHVDYAQITYQPVDGQNVGQSSVLTVDVTPVADAPTVSLSLGDISEGGSGSGSTTFTFDGITLVMSSDGTSVSASGMSGNLIVPPFDANSGGNLHVKDPATDIVAVIGNFDQVVLGRDGDDWEDLKGINAKGDYVFFNKPESAYEIVHIVVNVHDGVPQIEAQVKDLATGITIVLNNIRGILFGDGGSVGGDASKHISGLDTQTVEGGYHDVDVHVVAALTDRDGSESLSGVTLSGVPEGVTIEGATQLSNGDWFVANSSGLLTVDTHLTMRVPNGTEPFSLTASATSSEYGASANSSTTTVTLDAVDVEASATITIDNVTGDNVVNATEAASTVVLTGSVGGDAKVGDTVTVHVGDHSFVATVAEGKTWTVSVDGSVLAGNASISASVTASDGGGNTTTANATHDYSVDTSASATIMINDVAGDNVIDTSELSSPVVIAGSVGGDAKAGDVVTVTVGDHTLTTTVDADNTWSVDVAGSALVGGTSITASVAVSDAAGNTAVAGDTHTYSVDSAPTAQNGSVQGVEDTPLVLTWNSFNVSDDSSSSEQGLHITGLPTNGVLEYSSDPGAANAVWTTVTLTDGHYDISRADIDAGKLRFVPAENESSSASGSAGLGNGHVDYAQITYQPVDAHNVGDAAVLTVDVTPVADAPDVSVSVVSTETTVAPAGGSSSDIIQVNGGSGSPDGFDVQDGKIIKIGDNVRVWLTEGDTVPEAASADQIQYYTQGNVGGDSSYADIFVVHSQSGYFYRQSDWTEDQKQLRHLDSVHGNSMSAVGGEKDYIFVQQEDGYSYTVNNSTNNNNDSNVNTMDGVTVHYSGPDGSGSLIGQVSNQLEGVIFGNGQTAYLADSHDTTFNTVHAATGTEVSYAVSVSAAVTDTDGSEYLGNLVLDGIPAGAVVAVDGTLPTGLALVQNGETWELRWDAGTDHASMQHVDVTLTVTGVAEGADFTGVTVHASAYEVNGSTASSASTAVLAASGEHTSTDSGSTDSGTTVPDSTDSGSTDAGHVASAYTYSDTSLLVNGDFSHFANQTQWWDGNNDQGYQAWAYTGPFLESKSLMADRPYVGAWNNDSREITLSQDVSGVTAGSRLDLDIAWNNPNNGDLNDPWNAPKDTGNAMHLEISFDGVVYAIITTPSAGEAVGDSWYATVTAMNGASVNIDKIETWSYDYSTANGNNGLSPSDLSGFHHLQITLPEDVASSGQLEMRWDPQSEGSQYTDDLMVANLQLFQANIVGTTSNDTLVGTSGNDILIGNHGNDVLYGGAGDDVFKWQLGDEGSTPGQDVVKDFGLNASDPNGNDVLDLRDLLVGEHSSGDLTSFLHIDVNHDNGVANTVISVATHGGMAADGTGFNHQIVLENVDLMGSYHDQSQLIQNLINEGKLKVDQ